MLLAAQGDTENPRQTAQACVMPWGEMSLGSPEPSIKGLERGHGTLGSSRGW